MPLFVGASESYDTDAWEVYNLEKENAKLRELVKTYGMIANDRVLDYFERDEMLEAANIAARELGIEVD